MVPAPCGSYEPFEANGDSDKINVWLLAMFKVACLLSALRLCTSKPRTA
jgi:hypothetical protein